MHPNQWLSDMLRDTPGKSKSGLAKHLGVAPARVTEIIKGERKVKSDELTGMSEYLHIPIRDIMKHLDNRNVGDPPLPPSPVGGSPSETENPITPTGAGAEAGMTEFEINLLRMRIKTLASATDLWTAVSIIDGIIQELAREADASKNPRQRA